MIPISEFIEGIGLIFCGLGLLAIAFQMEIDND